MIKPLSRVRNNLPLIVGLCLLAAMAINTVGHPSAIGYDVPAHLAYAKVLSTGHLPRPDQTVEFYTPPLSYWAAAILWRFDLSGDAIGKVWQCVQLVYAFVLLVQLNWIADRLRFGNLAKIVSLLTLGSAAVWWRTFTFTRPEPLIVVLIFTALRLTIPLFDGDRSMRRFALAGLCWGGACLTRQWGILAVFSVIAALPAARDFDRKWWKGVALAALICAAVAGPFYLSLHFRFGSVKAMKQSPVPTRLTWRPHPVYAAGHPFSPALRARPIDILYADAFGDYWMYFLVNATDRHGRLLYAGRLITAIERGKPIARTNVPDVGAYLHFVLIESLVITGLIAASVVASGLRACRCAVARHRESSAAEALLVSLVVVSLGGYFAVLALYTVVTSDTDTTKASYMFQTWPAMALLVGLWMQRLSAKRPVLAKAVLVLAAATFIANAGTYLSRFIGVELKLTELSAVSKPHFIGQDPSQGSVSS